MDSISIAAIDKIREELPQSFPTYLPPDKRLMKEDIASLIDHTLLRLDTTESAVDRLCKEAKECGFKVG
jgi:hypothetical protein